MPTYKVIGACRIRGVRYGNTVELPDTPQTAALVKGGHIKKVSRPQRREEEPPDAAPPSDGSSDDSGDDD